MEGLLFRTELSNESQYFKELEKRFKEIKNQYNDQVQFYNNLANEVISEEDPYLLYKI